MGDFEQVTFSGLPELFDSLPPAALIKGIQDERLRREAEQSNLSVAEHIRNSYAAFYRSAWALVSGGRPLRWNWHIDAQIDIAEGLVRGDYINALVTVPFRVGKSTLWGKTLQPWVWLQPPLDRDLAQSLSDQGELADVAATPSSQWLCLAHAEGNATRDCVASRRVVRSQWYQDLLLSLYGDQCWELASDQSRKTWYENSEAGRRVAKGIGSGMQGDDADWIIIDDAHNARDVHTESALQIPIRAYGDEINSRKNSPLTRVAAVGQRVADGDFADYFRGLHETRTEDLTRGPKTFVWLCIAQEYGEEPENAPKCPQDPRTEPGELMWPEHHTQAVIDQWKKQPGWSAQGNNNPGKREGEMVKVEWLRERWRDLPDPSSVRRAIAYFDYSFGSQSRSASGNCMHLYFEVEWADRMVYLLVDRWWERGDACQEPMIEQTRAKWKKYMPEMYIENKASGPRVVANLRKKYPGLLLSEPPKGNVSDRKIAAFQAAVVPIAKFRSLILPVRDYAPWVYEVERILTRFPNVRPNDDADCASGALWEMTAGEKGMNPDDILVW